VLVPGRRPAHIAAIVCIQYPVYVSERKEVSDVERRDRGLRRLAELDEAPGGSDVLARLGDSGAAA
jgi:hypothetical protein